MFLFVCFFDLMHFERYDMITFMGIFPYSKIKIKNTNRKKIQKQDNNKTKMYHNKKRQKIKFTKTKKYTKVKKI